MKLITVGEQGETLRLIARTPTLLGQTLELAFGGTTRKLDLPLIGAYQAANALVSAGLVIAAGGDPAELIRDHAKRISYVHLKGFQREPFDFTPLDRGDISTAPILQALRDIGYKGWVCAELDAWPDPAEGARISMTYLTTH